MSVIARQSIKYSIVGYFSTLVGIFSTVFLYPYNLDFSGKLQFVYQTALLILPVIALGIMHANVRFFPEMSEKNTEQDLFKFSVVFILSNFLLGLILLGLASLLFPRIKIMNFWAYTSYILSVALLLSLIQLTSKYISIKKRIVVPNIFENLFPKLGMITGFILLFWNQLQEEQALWIFVAFFGMAFLGMLFYLNRLEKLTKKVDFTFLKQNKFGKDLFIYSFYTFLGSMGSVIALNIDTYMIGEMLSFQEVSIYNTSLNLVRMITVPALGVYSISAPIIAQYISENKMQDLKNLHHKTSLYLFVIGVLLFGLVTVGIEDLFTLMKNGDKLAKGLPVLYIMGFALLFDLATGFNGYIITNSKYYKFNNTTTVALALLTILTNLIFLFWFKLGIIGVSIATAISLTTYNLIKIYFNYKKFGIHPFSWKFLHLSLVLIFVIIIGQLLPNTSYKLINLCYKPFVALSIFCIMNWIFKIVPIKDILPKSLMR
ncbi:lipopolysaccharide biosynthesis protein [Flavobacterium oreochromis]|uniref:Polysaccharide biosynthesis protein C-terminal domain-containing protein n=1 Tax=Flavobacterium columnare TaxID=996 RepID=A0A2D0AI47_9FLAO|nr:MATE family efflux transporter [Flavobacterium oreochromis]OWP79490.1 hypothetical protein BWK62_02005 [Flavobacterium oreochromis]